MSDRYAVIGNPIAHSLSPDIHSSFALQTNQELNYERVLGPLNGFVKTVDTFRQNGGCGLNVTAPFKTDAFEWADVVDDHARKAKAVNTIKWSDNQKLGFNTDGIGLVRDLDRLGWPLLGKNLLIVGTGGATMGILEPLIQAGAKITLTNRTYSKAQELASEYDWIQTVELHNLASGWDIVLNATSVRSKEGFLFKPEVTEGAQCYDLTYSRQGTTPFGAFVSNFCDSSADGLGMLVEQAAESFYLWRGVRPKTSQVIDQLRTLPSPKKRFIAGATCPRCNRLDRIYIELDSNRQATKYVCADCGFQESSDGSKTLSIG